MKEESFDKELLLAYGEYVMSQEYPQTYLDKARKIISGLSTFMVEKLKKDGRKGACVDMSMVLSRMLDELGVWSVPMKGGLTIEFPLESGLPTSTLAPITLPGNPAVAGHAWVHAPPFRVVDLTVGAQPYSSGQGKYIPDVIISEVVSRSGYSIKDVMDEEAREQYRLENGKVPTLQTLDELNPRLKKRIKLLGPFQVRHGNSIVRYVPTAVSVSGGPLSEIKSLQLSGKYGAELLQEYMATSHGGSP